MKEEAQNTEQPAEAENTETEYTVPGSRFKEVTSERNKLREELEELRKSLSEKEAEEEKRRQAELKQQAKYAELAEELQGKLTELEPALTEAQKRSKRLEEILAENVAAQLENLSIPDSVAALVAKMPVEEQIAWLTESASDFAKKELSGVPETPAAKGPGEVTDEERRRLAAKTF